MPMWDRDASWASVAAAGPRHRAPYLYGNAAVAKSSNARQALRTVDDRAENRNRSSRAGECSVQVRAGRVSLKARGRELAKASQAAGNRESAARQCRPVRAAVTTLPHSCSSTHRRHSTGRWSLTSRSTLATPSDPERGQALLKERWVLYCFLHVG